MLSCAERRRQRLRRANKVMGLDLSDNGKRSKRHSPHFKNIEGQRHDNDDLAENKILQVLIKET